MSIQYEFRFDPIKGTTYYAYQRPDGSCFISLIAPGEWGNGESGKELTYLKEVIFKDGKEPQ